MCNLWDTKGKKTVMKCLNALFSVQKKKMKYNISDLSSSVTLTD